MTNMNGENPGPSILTNLKQELKKTPVICKIAELVLCLVGLGLIVGPFSNYVLRHFKNAWFVYTAIGGYVVINLVLILSFLLGEKLPRKTSLAFAGLGAFMLSVAGIILIYTYVTYEYQNMVSEYHQEYLDQMCAAGVFAFLAAIVFGTDTFFIVTNKYD